MKLCGKHLLIINELDNEIDPNIVFSKFINEYIGPEHQDSVDKRKDHCPICYLGKEGISKLKEIIEKKELLIA